MICVPCDWIFHKIFQSSEPANTGIDQQRERNAIMPAESMYKGMNGFKLAEWYMEFLQGDK